MKTKSFLLILNDGTEYEISCLACQIDTLIDLIGEDMILAIEDL